MTCPRPYHRWEFTTADSLRYVVVPDGCRDVLIIDPPQGRRLVVLTSFDMQPRITNIEAHTQITGFRLRPGLCVNDKTLSAIINSPESAAQVLADACDAPGDIDELISALAAPGASVQSICRQAGISTRTLQRVFQSRNLPSPDYWRLLGRARRAALLIQTTTPLIDVAYQCGFCDQAHMTRELLRWFGITAARLRHDRQQQNVLGQPALGNWTGEQISTR